VLWASTLLWASKCGLAASLAFEYEAGTMRARLGRSFDGQARPQRAARVSRPFPWEILRSFGFGAGSVASWALCALWLASGPSACSKPQPPSVTPRTARVTGASLLGLDVDLELEVKNPNAFPLSAHAVTGTLFIGDQQKLGEGSARPEYAIPAHGSSLVSSRVHIDWQNLTALAPFLGAAAVPYAFRGDVAIGGEDVNVTLPFVLEGRLTQAELLQLTMRR
jgi:LEA14-like dessication related protein